MFRAGELLSETSPLSNLADRPDPVHAWGAVERKELPRDRRALGYRPVRRRPEPFAGRLMSGIWWRLPKDQASGRSGTILGARTSGPENTNALESFTDFGGTAMKLHRLLVALTLVNLGLLAYL